MTEKKPVTKFSRVFFHDCVPVSMHIVGWFLWLAAMLLIGSYTVTHVIPMIGMVLLNAAAIPEDAMLVVWVYGYIMPYAVACLLMVCAYVLGARAIWRWFDRHVSAFAERVRVWYDKRA